MGSVARVFKKATKAVTKPISKAFKGVAKGIMKVGKATMRGVAKLNKKLGPLGSIALAIAMPYALGGLSTMTTAAMNSTNTFLRAIGTVGNQIRTGYQAFNAGVKGFGGKIGGKLSSITNSIKQGFSNFAPKGSGNIFRSISNGAKSLYNSAKNTIKQFTPKFKTAKPGSVEFYGVGDPGVGVMSSTDAAAALQKGTLKSSQLGKQVLTSEGGFFTKANPIGTKADKYITETINNAYKTRLDGFGPNATKMFTDTKARAIDLGTYTNDEAIGSFIENNVATNQNVVQDFAFQAPAGSSPNYKITTEINDLSKTGNYIDNGQGGFRYTGEKTFKAIEAPKPKVSSAIKKGILGFKDKLLADTPRVESDIDMTLMGDMTNQSNFAMASYGGTDIKGTAGGELIAKVFGNDASNLAKTYYKNMNLVG